MKNPSKVDSSVADWEIVQFDIVHVPGRTPEAIHVTGVNIHSRNINQYLRTNSLQLSPIHPYHSLSDTEHSSEQQHVTILKTACRIGVEYAFS